LEFRELWDIEKRILHANHLKKQTAIRSYLILW